MTTNRRLGDLVRFVGSDLVTLIGSEGVSSLITGADRLPASFSRFFGFEVSAASPGADLLVQVRPGTATPTTALLRELVGAGDDVAAGVIRTLMSAMADQRDPDHAACGDIWLEYDLGDWRTPTVLPVPSVFFGVNPHFLQSGADSLAVRLVDRLTQWDPNTDPLATLRGIAFDDPDVTVVQQGVMLGRSGRGLRLCLSAPDPRRALMVLERNGWRGDRDGVMSVLAGIGAVADWWMLDVDVAESGVTPRIGIELGIRPGRDPEPGWRLARAVADSGFAPGEWCELVGGCRRAAWVAPTANEAGLMELARRSAELGPELQAGLLLSPNHFKITMSPTSRATVKAYIGVREATWRPTNPVASARATLRGQSVRVA